MNFAAAAFLRDETGIASVSTMHKVSFVGTINWTLGSTKETLTPAGTQHMATEAV